VRLSLKGLKGSAKWSPLIPASLKCLNRWALVINSAPYANNREGHINCTPLVTVISITPIVLLAKGIGAQVSQVALKEMEQQISTIQIKENAKGQILLRYITRK